MKTRTALIALLAVAGCTHDAASPSDPALPGDPGSGGTEIPGPGGPGPSSEAAAPPGAISSALVREEADVPPSDAVTLAAGNLEFAFELYDQVRRDPDQAGKNLALSPHSVSVAFGMLRPGANGATATAIDDVMRYRLPGDRLHAAFNALDRRLAARNREGVAIATANAAFVDDTFAPYQDYVDTITQYYGAGVAKLDLNDIPVALEAINGWVEDRTRDRIVDLLQPAHLMNDPRLVLVNAISFDGTWQTRFEESMTSAGQFERADGSYVTADLMHATMEMQYGEGADYYAGELPYVGDELAMTLIVPRDGVALSAIEERLDSAAFQEVIASLHAAEDVQVTMPKFEFRAPVPLTQVMQDMGMERAFGREADFSLIANEPLYISDVIHQAFIHVDEAGTEAAAATAIIVGRNAAVETTRLSLNRPFLFAIRDRVTGSVLFLGRVLDPSAAE